MPLLRWLNSLILPKPTITNLLPPPRGEGWGGGLAQSATPTQDHSHRIHIAANDPAFPAKREAAVALICQAITDIATPLGYACKGTTWARQTARGKSAIHLQRSQYGFTAMITLRFLTPDGASPEYGIWAQEDDIGLHHFYLPNESLAQDNGALTYLDISENPDCLTMPLHVLKTRALPWLDAHHLALSPPNIEDFRRR